MKMNKKFLSFFLALLLMPCMALAGIPEVPENNIFVNDYANEITQADEDEMTRWGEALEDACGAQVAAVVVDFFDGMTADDYAYELFNEWGIGEKDKDNGVLFLLGTGAREYQIMLGEGIEDEVSVSTLLGVLDETALDDFADNNFSQGMRKGYIALCETVADVYNVSLQPASGQTSSESRNYSGVFSGLNGNEQPVHTESKDSGGIGLGTILLIIIVVLILTSARRKTRVRRSSGSFTSGFLGGLAGSMLHSAARRPRAPRPPHPPMGGRPPMTPPRPTGGGFGSSVRVKSVFGGGSTRGAGGGRSFGSSSARTSVSRSSRSTSSSSRSSGSRSFGGGRSRGSSGGRKF